MVWSSLAGGLLSGKYNRNEENKEGGRILVVGSFKFFDKIIMLEIQLCLTVSPAVRNNKTLSSPRL